MKTNHASLYAKARYYDIAFDFRDVPTECDFLDSLVQRFLSRRLQSVLELAAGPAKHSREFARRGLAVTALDAVPEMVDYALAAAKVEGTHPHCVRGDMVRFQLEKTYDLAVLLMNSSAYLLDNEMVLQHLDAVADHLHEGGLYLLEMEHPRDVFQVGSSVRLNWSAERDGIRVSADWGAKEDVFDPIAQVSDVTVTVRYDGPDESGVLTDLARMRRFTANEFKALVKASGRFEIVDIFGAMDAAVPFTNDKAAWRMVPLLRKLG